MISSCRQVIYVNSSEAWGDNLPFFVRYKSSPHLSHSNEWSILKTAFLIVMVLYHCNHTASARYFIEITIILSTNGICHSLIFIPVMNDHLQLHLFEIQLMLRKKKILLMKKRIVD